MDIILHGTMGNNMIFDIVSRDSILFDYFLLFPCHFASQLFFWIRNFLLFSVFVFMPEPWWNRSQAFSPSTMMAIYERINRRVKFPCVFLSNSRKRSWLSFLLSKMKFLWEKVSARVPGISKLWCDHTVVKIAISPLFRLFMVLLYWCSVEIHTVEFSPFLQFFVVFVNTGWKSKSSKKKNLRREFVLWFFFPSFKLRT